MKFKFTLTLLFAMATAFAQNNTFPSSGNVGIGTTNPSATLETKTSGTNRSDGGLARFLQPDLSLGNDVSIAFGKATGTYQSGLIGYYYGQESSLISFSHWGDNQGMVIKSGGNVGIGILNPVEKLAVNGNIRAKEIKVEAANWPDYVFDQDYKILGLQELDAYIKTNKRLPEMPSAKEVERDGIKLGEVNKLLLKKIEELTLHLIEKDQEILQLKKLEVRFTELENKVNKQLDNK